MRLMIVGATGLVGQGVLAACRAAADVERIVLLGRRRVPCDDPRVTEWIVPTLLDLDPAHPELEGFDACLFCAGVVPGFSEATYRQITVELTLHVARAFAAANAQGTFVYVSGAGANSASRLMPLRVKGDAEAALRTLGIHTLMLRPGIVQPVDGVRSGHLLRAAAYTLAGPMLGAAARMAPTVITTSTRVGRAMLSALRDASPPAVLENAEINARGE